MSKKRFYLVCKKTLFGLRMVKGFWNRTDAIRLCEENKRYVVYRQIEDSKLECIWPEPVKVG